MEPLLAETSNRYVLYPIVWTDVWNEYKKHQQAKNKFQLIASFDSLTA